MFAPSKAYVSRTLSWLHPAAESGNLLPALNPSRLCIYEEKKHPKFSLAPLPKLTTTSIGVLSMTWTSYNATRFRLVLHPLCFAQIWDWFNKVQQCLKWASTTLQLLDPHSWSILFKRHGLHMLRVFMKWMKLDSSQRSLVQTIIQLVEPTLSSGSLRFSQSKWRRTCPRQSSVAAANQCSLGVLPIIAWRCIILHLRFQTISSPGR